ncbi:MAG: hydrogenase nickel incorporation protein HypB [Bdellovibrio sp.]|nr:hydrogenase nickel incorporation protein HypB [Bdellovibrio sp.]
MMCDECGRHETKILSMERNIFKKNSDLAEQNRLWFKAHGIRTINMMSSPGSGKTTLLEKTTRAIQPFGKMSILVGDVQTEIDADRLRNAGAKAQQINTWNGCHLDAAMIARQLGNFVTGEEDLLMIENVGNLVCPAAFDLGEQYKVALLSITEGEDKPLKYPALFHQVDLILITKIDLEPFLSWNREKALESLRRINHKAHVIMLSALSGMGMEAWVDWLKEK